MKLTAVNSWHHFSNLKDLMSTLSQAELMCKKPKKRHWDWLTFWSEQLFVVPAYIIETLYHTNVIACVNRIILCLLALFVHTLMRKEAEFMSMNDAKNEIMGGKWTGILCSDIISTGHTWVLSRMLLLHLRFLWSFKTYVLFVHVHFKPVRNADDVHKCDKKNVSRWWNLM